MPAQFNNITIEASKFNILWFSNYIYALEIVSHSCDAGTLARSFWYVIQFPQSLRCEPTLTLHRVCVALPTFMGKSAIIKRVHFTSLPTTAQGR
jgi:hypothetical protein